MLKLPVILLTSCLIILTSTLAQAATFSLTYIGALATGGASYTHWWYTGTNPTLKGTADPAASVTITIDGTAGTATADGSGNWTYTTTTLSNGDHTVTLASGVSTIAFTLTIGSTVPQSTGSGTPSTALTTPILLLALAAVTSVGLGYRLLRS